MNKKQSATNMPLKDMYKKQYIEVAKTLGMLDEFIEKRNILTREAIAKRLRTLADNVLKEKWDSYKGEQNWVFSPAGDGYGDDNYLFNLIPETGQELTLESLFTINQ